MRRQNWTNARVLLVRPRISSSARGSGILNPHRTPGSGGYGGAGRKGYSAVSALRRLSLPSACTLALLLTLTLSSGRTAAGVDRQVLQYKVYYLGMRVGELALSARDSTSPEGEALRVVHVRMKTRSVAGALFPIENEYRVVYNSRSNNLRLVQKRIQQKNLSGRWILRYEGQRVTLQRRSSPEEHETWRVEPPVLDVISILDLLTRIRCRDSTLTVQVDEEGVPMRAQLRVFRSAKARFASAVFRPAGESNRSWKTDILTNRFSKSGAVLRVEFGESDPHLPVLIQYSLGPSMATAKLIRE